VNGASDLSRRELREELEKNRRGLTVTSWTTAHRSASPRRWITPDIAATPSCHATMRGNALSIGLPAVPQTILGWL